MVTELSASHGTRVLGKGKLSQNKSTTLLDAVIGGLLERGEGADAALGDAMAAIAVTHAAAREELVEGIREERRLGLAQPTSQA